MARAQQAKELFAIFRMRLGEPTEGTFRTVYYDEIAKNINEVMSIFNQAQDHVAWICYSANQSLLETSVELLLEPGVTRYILPEDYIGDVSVFHRIGGQEYEIVPENLDEVRRSTRLPLTDYRFRCYEIREGVPLVSARGIITTGSNNRITAGGAAGSLNSVRVGDVVYNLTDRSQSVVERLVYDEDGQEGGQVSAVEVGSLNSGLVNRFYAGDRFQVDMKEATRDAIDLFPKVANAGIKSFYSGSSSFSLSQDNVIVDTADITPESLPDDLESDDRVILVIESGDEIIANATALGLSQGSNKFFFPNVIQLRERVNYTARIIWHSVGRPVPVTIGVSRLELHGRDVSNFIDFKYAKLPRKIESLEDYCEMPSWSMEAVYSYGLILAYKKMTRALTADPGLVNEFNGKIKEIEDYRYRRDSRGPHSMLGDGRRVDNNPFPGNYAVGYVDPFDL